MSARLPCTRMGRIGEMNTDHAPIRPHPSQSVASVSARGTGSKTLSALIRRIRPIRVRSLTVYTDGTDRRDEHGSRSHPSPSVPHPSHPCPLAEPDRRLYPRLSVASVPSASARLPCTRMGRIGEMNTDHAPIRPNPSHPSHPCPLAEPDRRLYPRLSVASVPSASARLPCTRMGRIGEMNTDHAPIRPNPSHPCPLAEPDRRLYPRLSVASVPSASARLPCTRMGRIGEMNTDHAPIRPNPSHPSHPCPLAEPDRRLYPRLSVASVPSASARLPCTRMGRIGEMNTDHAPIRPNPSHPSHPCPLAEPDRRLYPRLSVASVPSASARLPCTRMGRIGEMNTDHAPIRPNPSHPCPLAEPDRRLYPRLSVASVPSVSARLPCTRMARYAVATVAFCFACSSSTSTRRNTLPTSVLGSSVRNSTSRGTL